MVALSQYTYVDGNKKEEKMLYQTYVELVVHIVAICTYVEEESQQCQYLFDIRQKSVIPHLGM
jgi:hypothetical protein